MRINFKQIELIKELVVLIQLNFTEVQFLSVMESPEDPNDLWVNILVPDDEDREIALTELASEKTTDMLLDYGYHISIMPRHKRYLNMNATIN